MKTKIAPYSDEATEFHDEEMSNVGSNYICLSVILMEFFLKKDRNFYLQVFLKKCKYIKKEKKVNRYTADDLEISSDDFDRE